MGLSFGNDKADSSAALRNDNKKTGNGNGNNNGNGNGNGNGKNLPVGG